MNLDYKGIEIYYTDKGKGNPIVLLHGFLENSNMWYNLAPKLLLNNRIITIDLLGHGQTGCLGYIHSMEQMAEAVDAVIKYLKINTFTCIGHSMGGYVALAYAEKNPDSLTGLCLMNSTFLADDNERKTLRTRANKMAQTNFEALIRMSFINLFSPESRIQYKSELEFALNEALKTPVQGYIASSEGMKIREDKTQLFKKLPIKKQLILGKKDPLINILKMKELLKNTDTEIIELPEGHMSYIENLKELTYNLLSFIEK